MLTCFGVDGKRKLESLKQIVSLLPYDVQQRHNTGAGGDGYEPMINPQPKTLIPDLLGSGRCHRLHVFIILQLGLHFELVLLGISMQVGSGVLSVGCVRAAATAGWPTCCNITKASDRERKAV